MRAGEVTAEPIRIADRDDPDPRVVLGDEATAVAGAVPGAQQARVRDVRGPREHGLEPVLAGVGAERGKAVQRDAAACRIEAGGWITERARAVRDVAREMRVRRGRVPEALDLPFRVG